MATTPAGRKAAAKYDAKTYDRIIVRLPKGTKEEIQATGESVNGFIWKAVMERLGYSGEGPRPVKKAVDEGAGGESKA